MSLLTEEASPLPQRRIPRLRGVATGREFIGLVIAMMASAALSIDLMLPAFGDIRAEFGMSPDSARVGWIITFYFFGLAAGPLLFGPASDRFGRRPPLFVGLVLFVVGATGAALAPSFEVLLVARALWGLGVSAPRAISLALVRDRYAGDAMARLMSMIMAVFLLVPVLAPSLGAGLMVFAPWRIVLWVPAGVAVVLLVWATLRLPETLEPERRRPLTLRSVTGACRAVFATRQTALLMAAMTFLVGVMTAYLSSLELIINDVYDMAQIFPFVFGGVGIALALSSLNNARLVGSLGVISLVRRLSVIGVATSAIMVAVVVLGDGKPPIALLIATLVLVIPVAQGLGPSCNTVAMQPLPHIAGTAAAVIATVTTAGGAVVGGLVNGRFDGSARPFAIGTFILVSLAAAAILAATGTVRTVPVEG